jgi:hypothetical protein
LSVLSFSEEEGIEADDDIERDSDEALLLLLCDLDFDLTLAMSLFGMDLLLLAVRGEERGVLEAANEAEVSSAVAVADDFGIYGISEVILLMISMFLIFFLFCLFVREQI